jgi:hypothetical protein
MKIKFLSFIFCLALQSAWSSLVIDQQFSYPDTASFHANSDGWLFSSNAGGESLSQMHIESGSLQKLGIDSGLGNKLKASGNYESTSVLFPNSSELYASALLRFDSVGRLDSNGTLLLYLGEQNIGSAVAIHARIAGANVQLGISKGEGSDLGPVTWNTSSSYAFGETIFFVLSYNSIAGSNNDIANAWLYNQTNLDPTWGTAQPSSPMLSISSGFADLNPNQFILHWNYSHSPTQNLPDYSIDSVRIGTTFGSVTPLAVPEPRQEALLLTLGSVALLFSYFRKRNRSRLEINLNSLGSKP